MQDYTSNYLAKLKRIRTRRFLSISDYRDAWLRRFADFRAWMRSHPEFTPANARASLRAAFRRARIREIQRKL